MSNNIQSCEQNDEAVLHFDVSDDALERAASVTPGAAAMSFPNAPTVSVLFACCGSDN